MFDLKENINKWRAQLTGKAEYKPEDIDELESHLTEEIENLKSQKNLDEEEAFVLAVHRVGNPNELSKEYTKVNSGFIWKKRALLFLGGYIFYDFFTTLNDVFSWFLFSGTHARHLHSYTAFSIYIITIACIIIRIILKKSRMRILLTAEKIRSIRMAIIVPFTVFTIINTLKSIGIVHFYMTNGYSLFYFFNMAFLQVLKIGVNVAFLILIHSVFKVENIKRKSVLV